MFLNLEGLDFVCFACKKWKTSIYRESPMNYNEHESHWPENTKPNMKLELTEQHRLMTYSPNHMY